MAEKRLVQPKAYPWDPQYREQPCSLAAERSGLLCVSGLPAATTVTANQLRPPGAHFGMEVWAVLE